MEILYFDPIEHFPDKIDQLLEAINRVCYEIIDFSVEIIYCFFLINSGIYLIVYKFYFYYDNI